MKLVTGASEEVNSVHLVSRESRKGQCSPNFILKALCLLFTSASPESILSWLCHQTALHLTCKPQLHLFSSYADWIYYSHAEGMSNTIFTRRRSVRSLSPLLLAMIDPRSPCIVVFYYDFLLILPDEARLFWHKDINGATMIFISARYLCALGNIPIVVEVYTTWSQKVSSLSWLLNVPFQ